MKQVLILGGSGGIGQACAGAFSNSAEYAVTSVHRQKSSDSGIGKTIYGDLCSAEFRRELVSQTTPNIVISSFGRYPSKDTSMTEAINEFVLSVVDLFEAFEAKKELEHFVVIGSLSGQISVMPGVYMDSSRYQYICAKRMLSDFFRQAQLHLNSRSKIVLIEPGFVRTNFANIKARLLNLKADDVLNRTGIVPLDPAIVAGAIFQAVSSPGRASVSITLHNESTAE